VDQIIKEIQQRLTVLAPYAPHLGALGVAVVLGFGVAAFKVSGDPPAVDTADRWPVPQWAPFRAGPQRDALARAGLWTPDPTRAQQTVEPQVAGPPWRFIGTLREGKSQMAVIELDQGKKVQRVTSGETLPNGALIKNIDTSTLTYDENGVEKVLKLFGVGKTDNLAAGTGKN